VSQLRLALSGNVLLMLVIIGCNQAPDPTTFGAPATTIPEPIELEATGAVLPAGTYTRADFEPGIVLKLDGSWQAVQLADGFFDVQKLVGTPEVIAVQFANVTGVVGDDAITVPADAEDAIEIMSENPAIRVVETSSSRIGGQEGAQVTIENNGDEHAQVLRVPPGVLGIDPGRRLWIALVDTDSGLLAVMVGGATEQWEQALAEAEPVLESVVIDS
jgi:hypothetical protein